MASKAGWLLLLAAVGIGAAIAAHEGHKRATARQAVGCAFDCIECTEGNVLSCIRCGACAQYL